MRNLIKGTSQPDKARTFVQVEHANEYSGSFLCILVSSSFWLFFVTCLCSFRYYLLPPPSLLLLLFRWYDFECMSFFFSAEKFTVLHVVRGCACAHTLRHNKVENVVLYGMADPFRIAWKNQPKNETSNNSSFSSFNSMHTHIICIQICQQLQLCMEREEEETQKMNMWDQRR